MVPTPTTKTTPKGVNDVSIALFLGGWIMGLAQSFHPGSIGFGHGFEMATIAKNLAEHGTFGDPFGTVITGPTAVVPPLYPVFLAALIKIFGNVSPWALLANIAANAVTAALLPRVAAVFYNDTRPGIFAGCLWLLAMPFMPQWDVSFTIALLVAGCCLTFRTVSRGGGSGWPAAASGVLAGLISLLNPAAMLVFVPWVVFLLCRHATSKTYAIRYGSTMILTAALCNVPWLARNYGIWHSVVLRTNFGMTLYSSNNDCAESSLFKDGRNGCYQQTHPVASEAELRLLRQLGEVEYDRRRTADALNWVRSHPARFGQLTMERIGEFWFPDPTPSPRVYAVWAITLLSVPGMIFMARKRTSVFWFVLFVWLVYPLVYYVAVSADRYRYPILWTSLLPAGYCLARLWPAKSQSGESEPTGNRLETLARAE